MIELEQLVKKGFSLIPLQRNSKVPIKGFKWEQFQYEKASAREVLNWRIKYGDINYGLVTGQISKRSIIDVDDLTQIPTLEMMIPNLWETCVVRTARGRLHFYFFTKDELKSATKLFGLTGVELKARGSYVVVPGSIVDGVEYKVESPAHRITKVPKVISELYKIGDKKDVIITTKESTKLVYRGKAQCISQILNYDIPEPGREIAYFICFSKLLAAGNTVEYAKRIIKLADSKLSDPLGEKEIDDKFNDKKIYPYSCSRINAELDFINCSNCQVRGGKNVDSLLMKNVHKIGGLTNSERGILALLDSYYKGEEVPSINEIQKMTGMNFYCVRDALDGLKEKGII